VICYKPALQVVVFVFLVSKSGNSMAVWRRKLPIPEQLRVAHYEDIMRILESLPKDKAVVVDE
jgi:hypothetical protein